MLSLPLALALADAGVIWDPAPGDRFALRGEQLREDVFWISELTIEVHHYADNTILGFNGTTEWALDSVPLEKTVWLPREDQLRALLGAAFVALTPVNDEDTPGWQVQVRPSGAMSDPIVVTDVDVEDAYAKAVLALRPHLP